MYKNINKELCIKKGLVVNDDYNFYYSLANYYKFMFENYLLNFVNLKGYSDQIKNSGLDFGIIDMPKIRKLHKIDDFLNMDYLTILNHFYIEKLEINDISILIKNYKLKNMVLNEELKSLISRTFIETIKNNYFKGKYVDTVYKISYSPEGYDDLPEFSADNNSLVLKIYYSRNTIRYEKEEFIKNNVDKQKFLDKISEIISNDVNNKLGIKCVVMSEKFV